jgi:hypothetical protein
VIKDSISLRYVKRVVACEVGVMRVVSCLAENKEEKKSDLNEIDQ